MKIYNKKKFADGCFFLVLGAALAGAMIWTKSYSNISCCHISYSHRYKHR